MPAPKRRARRVPVPPSARQEDARIARRHVAPRRVETEPAQPGHDAELGILLRRVLPLLEFLHQRFERPVEHDRDVTAGNLLAQEISRTLEQVVSFVVDGHLEREASSCWVVTDGAAEGCSVGAVADVGSTIPGDSWSTLEH